MSDFIKMDLHVHTPSSYDYLGDKTDKEYLEIVRQFHKLDFKIIAITDHNTVDGYFKIKELIKEKRDALHMLEKLSDDDYKDSVSRLKEEINIFNSIDIIPGIEVDVKPGLHLNILFNPDWEEKDVRDLVDTVVSLEMKISPRDDLYLHAMDILDLLDLLVEEDIIVVAAHFDGEKGIYGLEKNAYRANVFSHCRVDALEYLSESTKNKVKNIYLESKEYKREFPVAYIQSSDFHGKEPGKRFSYVKAMSDLRVFDQLRKAFSNPSIYVSNTENPEDMKMIEELIRNSGNVILRDKLNESELKVIISALLNSYNGVFIVGVDYYVAKKTVNWKGINTKTKDFIDKVEEALDTFGFTYPIKKHLIPIELSSGKNAYLLDFKAQKGYTSIDEKFYFISDREVVEGDYNSIMRFEREKIRSIANDLYDLRQGKIDELLDEIKLLSEGSRYVLDYIEVFNDTIQMQSIVSQFISANYSIPNSTKEFDGLGNKDGNLLVVGNYGPRLNNAILRVTCPRINYNLTESEIELNDYKMKVESGDFLIISHNYSAFIVDGLKDTLYISPSEENKSYMVLNQKEVDMDIYFLAAWFKSILFTWYVIEEGISMDIYDFGKLPIPKSITKEDKKKIIRVEKKIYEIENDFLQNVVGKAPEIQNEIIEKHNEKINKLFFQIDHIFMVAMGVGQRQFDYLRKVMKFRNYYCYEDLIKSDD